MKLRYIPLFVFLPSCMNSFYEEVHPDGTKIKHNYTQVGGVGQAAPVSGGVALGFDGQKSFGQAMTAGVSAYTSGAYFGAEKAKTAASAATSQAKIKAGAATEQLRIKTVGNAATTLGSNPEANIGAIQAAGAILPK